MTKAQFAQTAAITAIILLVVSALDYFVNALLAPDLSAYTPLTTLSITLLVAPAFTAYLIMQNAKVQRALVALAEERVARMEADGANAAKTQFLATMSHELRTPLNAIIGYAEMVEEETKAKGMGACAEDSARIRRSAHHLLALISEILDHARLESGKVEFRNTALALLPLFNEVAENARAAAGVNSNSFEAVCDAEIGSAYLDPMRLRQCMMHFTSNAAKFTKHGRISLRMAAVDDDAFLFEVADTGIGMSEETVARLFQPFVQADSSATREYGGTGLGLAITSQLAEAMGGAVSVRSARGEGSVFTLTMKRCTAGQNVVTLAA
jgi:signal transduction histidine kinase